MIYDAASGKRLHTKFKVNTSKKKKKNHFGGLFLGGHGGWRIGLRSISYLDCSSQWPKELSTHFGNDQSHRLGRV